MSAYPVRVWELQKNEVRKLIDSWYLLRYLFSPLTVAAEQDGVAVLCTLPIIIRVAASTSSSFNAVFPCAGLI
jgi:hypothetical protein